MLNPEVSRRMRGDVNRGYVDREARHSRLIVHVDMDAFFAAVEERDNPSLKGKPVIIGGEPGSRGVATTCNYKAREFGVHAGMSLFEAQKLCPNGIFLKTHGKKYTWTSIQLMALLRKFSPIVEPYSIDEAFIDGSGCAHIWGGAYAYGKAIKDAIERELNLTASAGVAPTKILAKIGSNLNKPNGLTIIEENEILEKIGDLSVRKIPGVGESTEKSLGMLKISTIRDLAEYPVERLKATLGLYGEALGRTIRGEKHDKVIALEHRLDDKSMGHEHTFSNDVADRDVLLGRMLRLCEKATRRMRAENYVGNLVTIKIRRSDFKTRTHQRKMLSHTDDPAIVFEEATRLLDDVWGEGKYKVRLIGVHVAGLMRPGHYCGMQTDIFNEIRQQRINNLYSSIDKIRDVYGDEILGFAGGMKSLGRGVSC